MLNLSCRKTLTATLVLGLLTGAQCGGSASQSSGLGGAGSPDLGAQVTPDLGAAATAPDLRGAAASPDLVSATAPDQGGVLCAGRSCPVTLGAATTLAFSGGAFGIAASDFNRDGKMDLAVVDLTGNQVAIYVGDGRGGFPNINDYASGKNPTALALGDFNNDSKTDIVLGLTAGGITTLTGNGLGGFGNAMTLPAGSSINTPGVALGDVNGDGDLDVIASGFNLGGALVMLGDGKGGFGAAKLSPTSKTTSAVLAADFNGDGLADVALGDSDGTTTVLLSAGSGGFNQPLVYSGSVAAIGDFNGDGRPDLATSGGGQASILLNKGNGVFAGASTAITVTSIGAGAALDMNGDGKLDLVLTDQNTNAVLVLLGDGAGGLGAPSLFPSGGRTPRFMTAADFNGDGKPDVALINYASANIAILLQQ